MDDEIGDEDLAVIAMDHLMDWEALRPFLGLSRVQKVEIAKSYPGDYGKQKRECLELSCGRRCRERRPHTVPSSLQQRGQRTSG